MTTTETRFSSLPRRAAVALVAIPAIVWLTLEGGYFFFAFVLLISAMALHEFYGLAERSGAHPLKSVGIVGGILLECSFIAERVQVDAFPYFLDQGVHLPMLTRHQLVLSVLILLSVTVLLVELFRREGSPTMNVATTLAGVVIIPLFLGTLVGIRETFPYGFPTHKFFPAAAADSLSPDAINRWGGLTLISLFVTIWICDTAAYFGGVAFGRHRLMEHVSPKKSWEGFWFGFGAAVATMLAARQWIIEYLPVRDAVMIGLFVGLFGQLGDLVQSRFKRDANVKDSSSIIPGHGGVYDRFDSLVFVSPIVYLYFEFIVLS